MKAVKVSAGQLKIEQQAEKPVVEQGEALIRPLLAGICNTDLELLAGYYGYEGTLGHEFVGIVEEGPAEWVGKRVVGEINIGCGECDFCLAGVPSQCRDREALGINRRAGVFADYFTLPVQNLIEVPQSLTDLQAAYTEPLAAACQVLEMAHIRPSDRVVLIGAGKLGMLTAQVVRLTGADLVVVVRHEHQAALLAGWGIPSIRFDALQVGEADVVVDCTGNESGISDALKVLKPRGTLVLKSTYHGLPRADLSKIAVNEIKVVGSRCGSFEAALRLLTANQVDVERLTSATYRLEEAHEAFAYAAQSSVLKVMFDFRVHDA